MHESAHISSSEEQYCIKSTPNVFFAKLSNFRTLERESQKQCAHYNQETGVLKCLLMNNHDYAK